MQKKYFFNFFNRNQRNVFGLLGIFVGFSVVFLIASWELPANTGQKLFYSYGCTCHHPVNDFTYGSLGPSLKSIRNAYNNDSGMLIAYLQGKREPIMDKSRASVMAGPLERIQKLSAKEYKLLAKFILTGK